MEKLLMCKKGCCAYSLTTYGVLCKLIRWIDDTEMKVQIVSGSNTGDEYNVMYHLFEEITLDEFKHQFPGESIAYNLINEVEKEPEKVHEVQMKFGEPYVPTEDEMRSLINECTDLLEEYNYKVTEDGIRTFLDEYFRNKGPLINVFRNHPNYNGKYQIAFDQNFSRELNYDEIYKYHSWVCDLACTTLVSYDWCEKYSYLDVIMNDFNESIPKEEYDRLTKKYDTLVESNVCISVGGTLYTKESYDVYYRRWKYADIVDEVRVSILNEEAAKYINDAFPEAKAVPGQKLSKVMNKLAKMLEIDKDPDYNRKFAAYSDAINPLKITRHTVLSLHPVDYLTMSFGNSWASCHTIDKENRRGMAHSYEGCYSAGTMSYMLDETSFVFYTVDGKYTGDQLELQPKIQRCMFHVGNDKLVQGRMYPQSTDGEIGIYRDVREIVQNVIAACFNIPNFWSIEKGISDCCEAIRSKGVHYRDYANFDYCNVSYLKTSDDWRCYERITVGHNPICPNCGCEHTESSNILCDDCKSNGGHYCTCCGEWLECGEGREIDGDWYCCNCSSYCEYHERYEPYDEEDMYYVEDYGYICEGAYESGNFVECERCYTRRHVDDAILTSDGNYYCCDACAKRAGYLLYKGEWYHMTEFKTCKVCGKTVLAEEIDEETGACEDCMRSAEAESEVA